MNIKVKELLGLQFHSSIIGLFVTYSTLRDLLDSSVSWMIHVRSVNETSWSVCWSPVSCEDRQCTEPKLIWMSTRNSSRQLDKFMEVIREWSSSLDLCVHHWTDTSSRALRPLLSSTMLEMSTILVARFVLSVPSLYRLAHIISPPQFGVANKDALGQDLVLLLKVSSYC
jgi:hypothetical protein